jgi:TolA-binding protein
VRGGVLLTALVLAVGAWGVWRGAHHAVYEAVQFSQLGDMGAAIATFRELRDRFPGTVWRAEAEYLLARALEQAGDCGAARALYRRVRDGDGNGREDAEDRLGRLTCA